MGVGCSGSSRGALVDEEREREGLIFARKRKKRAGRNGCY